MKKDKNRTETLAEQKLRQEYEKMKKCASHKPGSEDRLEENQYFTVGDTSAGVGGGRSVNNLANDYARKHGNIAAMAGAIKPAEALEIAIKRTLESGAPVNNIGFYDEVNWHLQRLQNSAVQPLAIKEGILKLMKKGIE